MAKYMANKQYLFDINDRITIVAVCQNSTRVYRVLMSACVAVCVCLYVCLCTR